MRALLLDRLPNVSVATKADAGQPLNGVKVTDVGLVQALLNYGSFDAYYYIRESSENRKAEEYENSDRLRALDLGSLESFPQTAPEDLILFTSSHHIAKFVPLRQFFGRDNWPICGRTHGLSASSLIPSFAWNYFADLREHDAIICTSAAGQHSLTSLFDSCEKSRSIAGKRDSFPIRLPLVHIDGIQIPDPPTVPSHTSKGFVAICIGRLTVSHKADLRPLIAAFLTSKSLPDSSTLILAGDDTQGHIAADLERFSQSFSSSNKVVVMPDISDQMKQSLLRVADVAVCMSDTYQETFGLSVLEAMAAGLPVVAPDWGGYRDIVEPGKSGFLANTSVCSDTGLLNAVSMLIDPSFALGQRVMIDMEEMMRYLSLLAKNRQLSKQLGENGRKRVENYFSWPAAVERLEELWASQILVGKRMHFSSPSTPLGFMNYDSVFQEHPKARVSHEAWVQIRADAEESIERAIKGGFFSPTPLAGFCDELDRRIFDTCRSRERVTITNLIEELQTETSGPSMITTQISRLVKYGLLSLIPVGSTEFQEQEYQDATDSNCAFSPVGI